MTGIASRTPALRERLARVVRQHVSFSGDSSEDRAQFAAHADESTILFARVTVLVCAALAFVWWPSDWITFHRLPSAVRAFAGWRLFLLTASAVSWIGLAVIERFRLPTVLPVTAMLLAMVARSYYVFGTLGDLQSPWIHTAILVPTLSSILTVRIGTRLVICAALAIAAMGSYLVAFPGFLAYPYLGHVVSYVTMTCAFATGVGHGLFILLRRDFFRRRELVRLATTDTLTGVFNRRHFLEAAEREVRRGRRYARPLSVLMIDVDSFKSINDGHGHPVGDEALRRFAALAAGILRQSDFIGRMGGDEFVIVLTETALGAAAAVAERLRAATTDAPLAVEGAAVPWSVSIGCAELAPGEEEIEAPLKRADRALLDAKRAGRNRVVASGAVEGAADRG